MPTCAITCAVSYTGNMARNTPKITVRPQTIEEELDRILFYLEKIDWYKQHGYNPQLPKGKDFTKPFSKSERQDKLRALKPNYRTHIYKIGQNLLTDSLESMKPIFNIFNDLHRAWGFKVYPSYEVVLTRYGMAGSYDELTGKIIMKLKDDGTYTKPARNTLVHEMVHIGIEDAIVAKFSLTQAEKERLVDSMVVCLFGEILTGYTTQSIGDTRIEPYAAADKMLNLPKSIKQYVKDYPREKS